jgi:hypothetical protein
VFDAVVEVDAQACQHKIMSLQSELYNVKISGLNIMDIFCRVPLLLNVPLELPLGRSRKTRWD